MAKYTTYIEVEVTVHYDYQPPERQVLYPNDEAYLGCDASVSINCVGIGSRYTGTDIWCDLNGDDQQQLIDEIMEHLTTGDR